MEGYPFIYEASKLGKERITGVVQVVEDLVHRVNPVGGEEVRAGKCA